MDKTNEQNFTIVVSNSRKEFFFAPFHSSGGLGEDWVPTTVTLPFSVVPRKGFEDGTVKTVSDYLKIFHPGFKVIIIPKAASKYIEDYFLRGKK